MIARQLIALGRDRARTVVTAHIAEHTITVDFADGAQRTVSRTSSGAIRNLKGALTPDSGHRVDYAASGTVAAKSAS